jgi:cell wall-associated NlpC family hydrolase
MNTKILIAAISTFALATSCKPLKSLSSKDTSSTQKQQTVRPDRRDVAFIDNIEVTPGNVVTSKHKTINTGKKSGSITTTASKKVDVPKPVPNENLSKADIEKADYLQLKYAVMLDATVEKLTNIPILQTIDHWWGTPYHLGGTTEDGIDCSAFMQVMMKNVYEISVLRTAHEQYSNSDRIEMNDLQEGDLVFFHNGSRRNKRVSHVGFYLMNNKFVHASTSSGVMISDLNDAYWKQHFHGCGRVKKA